MATTEEMTYYLRKWVQKRYVDYKVLYLASHGVSGTLELGKDSIHVVELADLLRGKCAGRVVFFASCLTLTLEDEELQAFAKTTKSRAVVGYSKWVDWFDRAAFELLLLDRIVSGSRTDAFFNGLVRDHQGFARKLGLIVATPTRVYDATKLPAL